MSLKRSMFCSVQYAKILALKSFYFTLKNNRQSVKLNQNKPFNFNPYINEMGSQGL